LSYSRSNKKLIIYHLVSFKKKSKVPDPFIIESLELQTYNIQLIIINVKYYFESF